MVEEHGLNMDNLPPFQYDADSPYTILLCGQDPGVVIGPYTTTH